ncbi:hypothetical protein GCM10009738_79040 [Kitasatospora viridis]
MASKGEPQHRESSRHERLGQTLEHATLIQVSGDTVSLNHDSPNGPTMRYRVEDRIKTHTVSSSKSDPVHGLTLCRSVNCL